MKILKGLLTFIISFVLVVLIIGLTASYTVKDVIQHQLVGEVAKKFVIQKLDDEADIDADIIERMIDDEKTDLIIDSAIVDFTSYVEGKTDGVSAETVNLIIDFCVSHKADLEELAKKQYEISEIDSKESRDNLKKMLDETITSVKVEKDSPVVTVVSTYGKVTSDSFRTNILVVIFALVFLLGIINWSLYKWMKSFGSVLITSGIMVLLSYGLSSVLFSFVKDKVDIALSINVMILLILGIVYLVSGIVLLIIYSIINKIVNKKKKQRSMIEDDDDEEDYVINSNSSQEINESHEEVQENSVSSNDNEVVHESVNEDTTTNDDDDVELL